MQELPLFCRLVYRQHLDFKLTLAEGDLYNVADLDLVARLDLTAVYAHALGIAGVVGNASALYKPRNLKVFIKSHDLISFSMAKFPQY